MHLRFPGRDMFSLSVCWRCILLVCQDLYTEILSNRFMDHGLAHSGGQLDCHHINLFLWRTIDFVRHCVVGRRVCTYGVSDGGRVPGIDVINTAVDVLGSDVGSAVSQHLCQ